MLRSEDPELYLEKAVHRLCDYYGKALTLEYVRNKIAWALYQTWKEFDKKSEERRMTLYDSDASEEYLLDGRYVIKPLVRCKDCKHRPKDMGADHDLEFPDDVCPCHCEDYWYSWMPDDDWFCANGERKEK